nr:hypothetical protein [Cronobacter sakazakii]
MQTTLTSLTFAGQLLWRVDFSPDTFTPADLLWLPHHAMLANAVAQRQAEHLAGRIAAVAALKARARHSHRPASARTASRAGLRVSPAALRTPATAPGPWLSPRRAASGSTLKT